MAIEGDTRSLDCGAYVGDPSLQGLRHATLSVEHSTCNPQALRPGPDDFAFIVPLKQIEYGVCGHLTIIYRYTQSHILAT